MNLQQTLDNSIGQMTSDLACANEATNKKDIMLQQINEELTKKQTETDVRLYVIGWSCFASSSKSCFYTCVIYT